MAIMMAMFLSPIQKIHL